MGGAVGGKLEPAVRAVLVRRRRVAVAVADGGGMCVGVVWAAWASGPSAVRVMTAADGGLHVGTGVIPQCW